MERMQFVAPTRSITTSDSDQRDQISKEKHVIGSSPFLGISPRQHPRTGQVKSVDSSAKLGKERELAFTLLTIYSQGAVLQDSYL
ncbi:unnamed protein product [Heligmosomoides polygyrus]|uniref:Uncharacterized protein n=1 Tax=Heligmosomoides polygyrus TaxID=6339 RepID=A0A183G866_HELPZ|nr:unnamed protein product [Heligmosomoides polygyrus]